MTYKIIIIDLDNTLIDFDHMELESLKESLSEMSIVYSEEMIKDYIKINHILWERLELGDYTKDEILTLRFEKLFKKYHIEASSATMNSIYLSNMKNHVMMMPGATELLEYVKGKATIICMTNGVQSAQHAKMTKANLYEYFDHVIVSDVVGIHKPDRGIFDHMMTLVDSCHNDEIVIIGDSLTSDIKGGNNFGIKTVWYNPNEKENQTSVKVDYEIKHLNELMLIL